jgi:hypothetical protein
VPIDRERTALRLSRFLRAAPAQERGASEDNPADEKLPDSDGAIIRDRARASST